MKLKKVAKRVLQILGVIVGIPVLGFLLIILYLTITEYKPAEVEALEINGQSTKELKAGDSLTALSWNVGYAALGETADFFMDGGKSVASSTKDQVKENLEAITKQVTAADPDVVFFQEVDLDSKRSYHIDEKQVLDAALAEYQSTMSINFRVAYIPYPFPTIGKVEGGIATFSKYDIKEANRLALPCPFSYPVSIGNLKRCLAVQRIPVAESDKELVLVNLHLEAYDDGEGKIEQTKVLRDVIQKEIEAGNYVIAAGDFNQTFSNTDSSVAPIVSEEMWIPGLLEETEFDDSLQFLMDSSKPSCRSLDKPYKGADASGFQYYIIDGFIISDNLKVESMETLDLDFVNSDHNPIQIKVTLQ